MRAFIPLYIDGFRLSLTKGDVKHIRSMRAKKGDSFVILYNNKHYRIVVDKIEEDSIYVSELREIQYDIFYDIGIIVSLLKPNTMDRLMYRLGELGVTKLIVYRANRSMPAGIDARIERWKKLLYEGFKITGTRLPQICNIAYSKEELLGLMAADDIRNSKKMLLDIKGYGINTSNKVWIACGPEGGFDKEERELFIENGFEPVRVFPFGVSSFSAIMGFLGAIWSM